MKYKLTDECINLGGIVLYRIQALKSFGLVKEGDLGGFVQSEDNLSQSQNCWIAGHAKVYDNARVYGNALIFDCAVVCDRVLVWSNAEVRDNATIFGTAKIYGHALVEGDSVIDGDIKITQRLNADDTKITKRLNADDTKITKITKRKPKRSREVLPGVYDL